MPAAHLRRVRLILLLALPALLAVGCASSGSPATAENGGRFQGYPVFLEAVYEAPSEQVAAAARETLFNVDVRLVDTLQVEPPSDRLLVQVAPDPDGARVRFGEFVDRPSYFDAAGIAARVGKAYGDVLVALGGEYREDTPYTAIGPARIVPQTTGLACPEGQRTAEGRLVNNGAGVVAVPEVSPELLPTREDALRAFYEEALSYPAALRSAKVQGTVVARFVLSEDGVPTCGEVVVGLPGGLNEIVLAAVGTLRFEPGKTGGAPVEVLYVWPAPFNASPAPPRR